MNRGEEDVKSVLKHLRNRLNELTVSTRPKRISSSKFT